MNAPCVVVLGCFTLAAASAGERAGGDRRADPALRGNWVCAAAVVDGKPLAEGVVKELRLTVTPDRYKTQRADEVLFDSTYQVDASKDPRQIEMVATEGDDAGKPALGIYAVDGDTLRMCYVLPGGQRPASFESKPGSKALLVTWKRAGASSAP